MFAAIADFQTIIGGVFLLALIGASLGLAERFLN